MNPLASPRLFPLGVLALATVLRVALAWSGGQYFHFDEARHERGVWIYIGLLRGDATPARTVAAMPEHALFPWVGAVVTAGQHLLAQATPHADWSRPENVHATVGLGAALLALFSAANLALAHRLARVAGARVEEANAALLLLAASNVAFYHARFLLPYDCSLTALLASLLLALHRPTAGRAFAAGLLLGAAYHLYNGNWYAVAVAWGVSVLFGHGAPDARRRLALHTAGAAAGLAGPLAAGALAGGPAYFAALGEFSRSVTQGEFAEGGSLPFAYVWHAEGVLGPALAAGVAWAALQAWRTRTRPPGWVLGAAAALAASYALLVLLSVGLERLVVYGRTLKPLVVPGALLGGWALAAALARAPRLALPAIAALAAAAGLNFAPHFAQIFPRDVEAAVARHYGEPARALSVANALPFPSRRPVTRPDLLLINAQPLYPVGAPVALPPGELLLRVTHPLSYLPFQYEGHRPAERARLRESDISIRLLKLQTPPPGSPPQ